MTKPWRDIFVYDSVEGRLLWNIKPSKNIPRGACAGGTRADGYYRIRYGKELYYGHRVIYEMFHGNIPEGCEIDHIDGDPSNNRIQNLRLVNHRLNMVNTKLRTDNKTGYKGISYCPVRNKFVAQLNVNGVNVFSKRFDTLEEAVAARKHKAEMYNGEYNRSVE